MLSIVLVEPEIPQNTGNIARTCAVTGARLHLVGPLGFRIDDAKLRRAGLDYWYLLDISRYDDLDEYFERNPGCERWYATTKADRCYADVRYREGCHILFGRETAGLPGELLRHDPGRCVRIPQRNEARSLNLSNAVAVICFEALRQMGFPGLRTGGAEL